MPVTKRNLSTQKAKYHEEKSSETLISEYFGDYRNSKNKLIAEIAPKNSGRKKSSLRKDSIFNRPSLLTHRNSKGVIFNR